MPVKACKIHDRIKNKGTVHDNITEQNTSHIYFGHTVEETSPNLNLSIREEKHKARLRHVKC